MFCGSAEFVKFANQLNIFRHKFDADGNESDQTLVILIMDFCSAGIAIAYIQVRVKGERFRLHSLIRPASLKLIFVFALETLLTLLLLRMLYSFFFFFCNFSTEYCARFSSLETIAI